MRPALLAAAVVWALGVGACGRRHASPAASPPDSAPSAPEVPATDPQPLAPRTAPEGPRAKTRWIRVLDDDAAALRLAQGRDGAVVAVTRGPVNPGDGRVTIQRVDADGAVAWKHSWVPVCDADLYPKGISAAGEVFLFARAWCDDPLPGVWPVPVGQGAVVVVGADGAFVRRIAIGREWYLASTNDAGESWTGEDRQSDGGLTFRKRAADGTVVWERPSFIGTKGSLDISFAPEGAYLLRDALLTRLRANGTSAWSRPLPARAALVGASLTDGAQAAAGQVLAPTHWGHTTVAHPGTAVLVTEPDGTPRGAKPVAGSAWGSVLPLPAGGVALVTRDDVVEHACSWIEAIGPGLETRWARRVDETCSSRWGVAVAEPDRGTIAIGALVASRSDFGEGHVVDAVAGKTRAVLVSIDASGGGAGETPPSPSRLDASWDVPASGPAATLWAREVPLTAVADARDGTALVTARATPSSFTLSRVVGTGAAVWTRTFDGLDCPLVGGVAGVTGDGGIVLWISTACAHAVAGLGSGPPASFVRLDRDGAFVAPLAAPAPSTVGGNVRQAIVDPGGGFIVQEQVLGSSDVVLSKRDASGALVWTRPEQLGEYAPVLVRPAGDVIVVDQTQVRSLDGGGNVAWRTPLGGGGATLVGTWTAAVLRDGGIAVAGQISYGTVSFGAGAVTSPTPGTAYVLWLLEPDGTPRTIVPTGATFLFPPLTSLRDGGVALVGGYGCPRVQALAPDGALRWDRPLDRDCQLGVRAGAGIDGGLLLWAVRSGSVDLGTGVHLGPPPLDGSRADALAAIAP